MELIEAFTRQDADLGSTFISEKEVTVKLKKFIVISASSKRKYSYKRQ